MSTRIPKYWLTPEGLLEAWTEEFDFNFDPAPHPRPPGFNGLKLPWGTSNYVNPPFRRKDGLGGLGPSAFVHKAIAEKAEGNSSVMVLPVQNYVVDLLNAGAEIRPLGRVKWEDTRTRKPSPSPSPICMFILRGDKS